MSNTKQSFHQQMAEAWIGIFSPPKIAEALFGEKSVFGRAVGKEETQITSHKAGVVEKIFPILESEGLKPTLLPSKRNLTSIRKLHHFQKFAHNHNGWHNGQMNLIYCKDCMNSVDDPDLFFCQVIATVEYLGEEGGIAEMKVTAVFPHNKHCTNTLEERNSTKLDRAHPHVPGKGLFVAEDYPDETIHGELFSAFLKTLKDLPKEEGGKLGECFY